MKRCALVGQVSQAFQDPVTREREAIKNKAIPAGHFVTNL